MGNGLYLDVSEDRMQAFNLTKSADFGTRECLHLETKSSERNFHHNRTLHPSIWWSSFFSIKHARLKLL